jgi:hypothetical protein
MEPLLDELIDMRRRATPGSVSRRLAERCLELCFQEVCANDERFPPLPHTAAEEFAQLIAALGR